MSRDDAVFGQMARHSVRAPTPCWPTPKPDVEPSSPRRTPVRFEHATLCRFDISARYI